ncbi:MAG TPA: hypothetical protein VIU33_04070 [Nitrospiria bacterium]
MKRLAFRSVETVTAVFLALCFFGLFLALLNTFFPFGSGLSENGENNGFLRSIGLQGDSVRGLILNSGGEDFSLTEGGSHAAVMTLKQNDVQSKRANEIAWKKAQRGMPLYDRDAIQTHTRSSARISFDPENHIDLGEKSLIIIRRLQEDPILRERRSFLVMFEGELRGRLSPKGNKGVYFEVETPSSVARITSRDIEEGPTDFSIKMNPDQSSVISVFKGLAEVEAQGQTVEVRANQAATVKPGQAPLVPEPLPEPPVLTEPGDEQIFYFRDLPPSIRFEWKTKKRQQAFHMVLAKDPEFKEIVFQEFTEEPKFRHGNLRGGTYYWRVSALEEKREGNPSPMGTFQIIQNRTPPSLMVNFPPETADQNAYTLSGKTDPGVEIRVGGKQVKTDSKGDFAFPLKLRNGINVVVVEAVDPAGNVSYQSKLINGKF